ncbi:ATP-binding protein [Argonema antarcticum]|uniref:ATP-binding protein n=1 Tax=Argonema antarcticum TaxID=2942763 RepID=UPI0020117033|nr:ATP-binding protein [Argonema antarcticum]MCL1475103.1 ATP-binding protein [Argonema antarcticum A004/B2]
MKAKIPSINAMDEKGTKTTYFPFENELDLCCVVRIEKDNRRIGAFLLNKGDISDENKFQVVFAFNIKGIHNQLYKEEVASAASGIAEAMKFLLPQEKCTFLLGRYSDDFDRQQHLNSLVENCTNTLPAILMQNEQAKVQELTRKGTRSNWQQMVFCTWTADEFGERKTDPLSKLIYNMGKTCRFFLDGVTGRLSERQEQVLSKVLMKAYTEGFLQWEMLWNTKAGLEVSPLRDTELWQWLWGRFNQTPTPPIPQLLTLKSDKDRGLKVIETITSKKHATTVLIEGNRGRSSCPEHRQCTSRIYVKDKVCGVLRMVDTVSAWNSAREQISWMWKILSENHVRDTEAWVEISPANRFLTEDNLHRQAKQSKTARERALLKGSGRDVGAEIKQEESFDAQKRLYRGAVPLNVAVVFLVYRENTESLDLACELLCNSFGTAKVVRERNIASQIWLETLPITWRRILHSSSILTERRLVLESETVAGVLPLTVPRELDKKGVEFLTMRGGKSVCVDLFSLTQHALITGRTGSGKSVLLWRMMLDALSQGIPVVGMDMPAADGESSFKTGIELLGDAGAYFDLSRASNNLMEPPDLRRFNQNERTQRMQSWRSFIRNALGVIVMGKLNAPHLAQRVDAILMQALDIFLSDPDIIERYNLAFNQGWKSAEWQEIPTLKDFLRFCTIARLDIRKPEAIDHQAINQIQSQIQALLVSPLGAAIGKPSSFSPEPIVKFYALTGLTNDQDSYTMAVAAKAACLRVALSYPKSLFVGDELSVLFKRDGFAAMVGELCATARKDGLSIILSSQDPDTICNSSAAAMIMQNITYRLTGCITSNAVTSFQRYLGYLPEIIAQNASESFFPRLSDLYSCWLIEKGGRFWQTRFYPGEMTLAAVATNQEERRTRRAIMAQYPNTIKGQLKGLAHFTRVYIPALKEGKGLHHLEQRAEAQNNRQSEDTSHEERLISA